MASTNPSINLSAAERKYAFRKRILSDYTEKFFSPARPARAAPI